MRSLVALEELRRSFGATRALDGVSFDVMAGEVHALVGENGAGKSTLMNILAGVLSPDGGRILIGGSETVFHGPQEAKAAGIATVFQELSLIDRLTVEENICANRAPTRFGLIDRCAMRRQAEQAIAWLGSAVPAGARVDTLLASQRQSVEIAKALFQIFQIGLENAPTADAARVLILDEPTSALNAEEKQALFAAVRGLRAQGVGVIYISHHLDEVIALADRITVLRDGATIWTRAAAEVNAASLVRAMVGRDIERSDRARGLKRTIAASFRRVSVKGQLSDLSFDLHAGEVLAVVGLDGSGREIAARLLAGLSRPDKGEITIAGQRHPGTLRQAMARGLGYVPDDRKALGLFLDMHIAANALAADLVCVSRFGLIRYAAMRSEGAAVIRRHGVKAVDPDQPVGTLSGGNQQKVLLGKWLRREPKILVVEEPTKGVDIGAKREIHDELVAQARGGAAVLVASSDLPEVLEVADRILVLHRGHLAGVLPGGEATEEEVMALASGAALAAE